MEKKGNNHSFFVNVLLRLISKINDHSFFDRAAAVTYYILLSIGPFMMLMFSIISYFLSDNVDLIIDFINGFYQGADLVVNPILVYLSDSRSLVLTIISVLAALFSSSKAAKRTIKSLEDIFQIERKSGIKRLVSSYVYAILFTLALALAIIIFFVFFVTGDPIANIVNYLFSFDLNRFFLWRFMKNIFPVLFLVVFVTAIFKTFSEIGNKGNEEDKINLFEAFLGAAFVSLGWIVGSIAFSFYINFSSSNAVYGALGSIMVMMLWFYFLIFMLFLGAGLIVAYTEEKEIKGKPAIEKIFVKNKN
ncbi:MAG: YihY/virulence factor BrkB family protein [Bacillota bacterium]|nr:YihY/virulence factor BrkB family protein [Bacillota bacterium]